MPITIRDDYERASVSLGYSSVSGDGDTAVVEIAPALQASNDVAGGERRWLEFGAKLSGVMGLRPLVRVANVTDYPQAFGYHGAPWQASRRGMWSVDGENWQYFDSTRVVGSTVEMRNNSPFPADTIYVGRGRQMSVSACGRWLERLAAAHPAIVQPAPSAIAFAPGAALAAFPAQQFIAGEFAPQQAGTRTIPATPFYAGQINDTSLTPAGGGPKRVAVLVSGVHAGEDHANYVLAAIIHAALADTPAARAVRREFRIPFYPKMNAPGSYGGGWRGSFTLGVNGEDDANRHCNESGTGLQIVDIPKAAMAIDRAGAPVAWAIDSHGTYGSKWATFVDAGVPSSGAFRAQLAAAFGQQIVDEGDSHPGFVSEYLRGLGASPSITIETGDPSPVTDAEIAAFGVAVVSALAAMTAGAAAPAPAPAPIPAPTPPPAPVSVVTRPTIQVSAADNPRHAKYDGSDLDNLAAMTVLARVRPVAPPGGNGLSYIFGKRASNGQPKRLMVDYANGSARLTFGSATTSALCPWGPVASSQRGSVVDGAWQMLGATYDGGLTASSIRLIVNTPVAATETTAGGGSVSPDAGNPLTLLNRQELDRAWGGDADWLAQWNRVLSPTEIDAVRTGGPDSVPSGRIVYRQWAAAAPVPVPVLGAISGALSGGMFAATQNADGSWDVTISARVGP